jgi:hypothetical protein
MLEAEERSVMSLAYTLALKIMDIWIMKITLKIDHFFQKGKLKPSIPQQCDSLS